MSTFPGMDASVADMDQAAASLNARLQAATRNPITLTPPPENCNALDRDHEFRRGLQELIDRTGRDFDLDAIAHAFNELAAERRLWGHREDYVEPDGDDLLAKLGGQLPLTTT
ncbi:MAG: hypothetical protein ACWGPR_10790 [Candidatus Deferrimicrobiaceae bacterium]